MWKGCQSCLCIRIFFYVLLRKYISQ